MEWNKLKMSVDKEKKAAHLRAVEEVLDGGRSAVIKRERFNWVMPFTVILTVVALCFVVFAPQLQERALPQETASEAVTAVYDKGYVFQSYSKALGKMPESILIYGVKQIDAQKLTELQQLIDAGIPVQMELQQAEPVYEIGLMGQQVEQYVRVYNVSGYEGYIFEFVEDGRMLEVRYNDLYYLLNYKEPSIPMTIAFILLAVVVVGYSFYVEYKYMKNPEGRKRKKFGKLWHGVVAVGANAVGLFYLFFAHAPFIPLAYAIMLSGIGLVIYLDRNSEGFAYRKYYYVAQALTLLFIFTMFSFVNTF